MLRTSLAIYGFQLRTEKIKGDIKKEDNIPAFRERLMLAVTVVNGCRYCSYFHARQA
jgi:hypothetical protein